MTGARMPTRTVAAHSATIALASAVSRITGMVRTAALGAALGGRLVADAYANATLFPGLIYEVVLGGMLSTVLVPMLVRLRKTDPDAAEAHGQRLLTGAVLVLGAITVLALLATPLLARISPDPATRHLTAVFCLLVLPVICCLGVSDLIAAMLNVRGRFAAPAWAPVINNLVLILASVACIVLPGPTHLTPSDVPAWFAPTLGLGTLLGGAAQLTALWTAARRSGVPLRWRADLRRLPLAPIAKLAGWSVVYSTVNQGSVLFLAFLANSAGSKGEAGLFIFNNAYLLLMTAHGIVTVSIMTVLLPKMGMAASAGRLDEVAASCARASRMSVALLVPVAVCYMVLSRPLATVLFQWGRFDAGAAQANAMVISTAAVALLPLSISHICTVALWSLADARIPALLCIPTVAVRVAVNVVLFALLPANAVAAAIMIGLAVSYLTDLGLAGWLLRRRVGAFSIRPALTMFGHAALAGGLAAVVGAVTCGAVLRWWPGPGVDLWAILIGLFAIAATYLAACRALMVVEPGEALHYLRRRLARGGNRARSRSSLARTSPSTLPTNPTPFPDEQNNRDPIPAKRDGRR